MNVALAVLIIFHDRHQRAAYEFLELQDNDLWEIVSGRSNRFDARHGGIVARLRAV